MIATLLDGAGKRVWLGKDGRLWRKTIGALRILVPVLLEKFQETWKASPRAPRLLSMKEGSVPTPDELAFLWRELFESKDQEVVCLWGRDSEGALVAVVPSQEGSSGGVEHDDPQALLDMMAMGAPFRGTVHSHPGACTQPSTTDVENWVKCPGVHTILGRDATYSTYAAYGGSLLKMEGGALGNEYLTRGISLSNSGGEPLDNLLKSPVLKDIMLVGRNDKGMSFYYDHELESNDRESQLVARNWWEEHTGKDYRLQYAATVPYGEVSRGKVFLPEGTKAMQRAGDALAFLGDADDTDSLILVTIWEKGTSPEYGKQFVMQEDLFLEDLQDLLDKEVEYRWEHMGNLGLEELYSPPEVVREVEDCPPGGDGGDGGDAMDRFLESLDGEFTNDELKAR